LFKKLLSALALAVGIISSAGCATEIRTVYVQEPLPLPERPEVPTIKGEELMCLSDEAYAKLVERDAEMFAHIIRLENIILSTHPKGAE